MFCLSILGLLYGPHHQRQHQLLPYVQAGVPSQAGHDGHQPRRAPRPGRFRSTVLGTLPQRITTHVSLSHMHTRVRCTCLDTFTHKCINSHVQPFTDPVGQLFFLLSLGFFSRSKTQRACFALCDFDRHFSLRTPKTILQFS